MGGRKNYKDCSSSLLNVVALNLNDNFEVVGMPEKTATCEAAFVVRGVPQGLVLGPLPVTPYYKTVHQLVHFLPAIFRPTLNFCTDN